MKDIAIYGAGGLGREVACLIEIINGKNREWNFIGFFDDNLVKGYKNKYGNIIGGMADLNEYQFSLSLIIAIGNPIVMKNIVQKIANPLLNFPNIISPDIIFFDRKSFHMGHGNIFLMACNISCNVQIGNFNVFNGNIPIGHDVIIGSFNNIMPSVNISGEVKIGDCNFFGVQSAILQQIKIGDNIRLGANSVLMKNATKEALYFGNPAQPIKL